MSKYILRQKEDLWERTTRGLTDHMKQIVNDKIENHIAERPYDNEELGYELSGLWSYNRMETDSRIIYSICEDCRKRKWIEMNGCGDCKDNTDNTIILWAFGGHKGRDIYQELRKMRKKNWERHVKQRKRERGY
jgi:Txe/YoeB family toxin of Txe-Axe toxin-antitoxin module